MKKTRRTLIGMISGMVTAGCATESPTTATNKSDNNKESNTTEEDTDSQVTSAEVSFEGMRESDIPENTPTQADEVLFVENPNSEEVLVAKTVQVHNGCASPDAEATKSGENEITVQFESVDNSSESTVCTTAIEPSKYAVTLEFEDLIEGVDVVVKGVNKGKVTYEMTDTDTEKIK